MRRLLQQPISFRRLYHSQIKGIAVIVLILACMSHVQAAPDYKPTYHFQTDRTITGQVIDSSGQPLQGVSVLLSGTKIGTTTDARGYYSLHIPDNYKGGTIIFSSTGYVLQEISIDDQKIINVRLKTNYNQTLGDVIVVGYGTQRKVSVTGAVDQISSKAIESKPVTNVLQALQGVSPNLIIQQTSFEPGSGVNLNIRGISTLGDNTPLVVIDGIIGGDINLLNPNDIASVSILKDAGSAAIYGSRSANGVILITTKSGKLNQKPSVTYNGGYGIQHPYSGQQISDHLEQQQLHQVLDMLPHPEHSGRIHWFGIQNIA